MHTDHFEDDILEFGDTELDNDESGDDWDLIDDVALIDGVALIDDADEVDDELIAPSFEEIQTLMSQIESTDFRKSC